jgi:hypothetical protein
MSLEKQQSNEFLTGNDDIPVATPIQPLSDDSAETAAVYHPTVAHAADVSIAHAATGDCRGCGRQFIRGEVGTAKVVCLIVHHSFFVLISFFCVQHFRCDQCSGLSTNDVTSMFCPIL